VSYALLQGFWNKFDLSRPDYGAGCTILTPPALRVWANWHLHIPPCVHADHMEGLHSQPDSELWRCAKRWTKSFVKIYYRVNISIPTPINRVGAPTILLVGADVKGHAPLNPASGTGERFVIQQNVLALSEREDYYIHIQMLVNQKKSRPVCTERDHEKRQKAVYTKLLGILTVCTEITFFPPLKPVMLTRWVSFGPAHPRCPNRCFLFAFALKELLFSSLIPPPIGAYFMINFSLC